MDENQYARIMTVIAMNTDDREYAKLHELMEQFRAFPRWED